MKGTSKVIMGATLVMVVSLAVVLGLILVLLAELYCSLLLRRRKLRNTTTNNNTIPTTTTTIATASSPSHAPQHPPPPPPPFSSIYAQGVLQAPRSFLFPCMEEVAEQKKQQQQQPHSELLQQIIHIQTQESNVSPRSIGLVSVSSSPPLSSFLSRAPQKPVQEDPHQGNAGEIPCPDKNSCGGGGGEHLVYISNPIYENEEGRASGEANTPFETPDTSPSRLERSGSSGDEDDVVVATTEAAKKIPCGGDGGGHSPSYTPPLTPMKKLPAEACSVSLRDARSLGTSASDSHSINGLSSSSSGSSCTSPSW